MVRLHMAARVWSRSYAQFQVQIATVTFGWRNSVDHRAMGLDDESS